jgi:hypothetical protein
MYPEHPTCTDCNEECHPVVESFTEPVEFWGTVSTHTYYEVSSNCCDSEVDMPNTHDYF